MGMILNWTELHESEAFSLLVQNCVHVCIMTVCKELVYKMTLNR